MEKASVGFQWIVDFGWHCSNGVLHRVRDILWRWYQRYFSNDESTYLVIIALLSGVFLYFFGSILTPLFAAIVLAYLMQGSVASLKSYRVPHLVAVIVVFTLFLALLSGCLFLLLPLAWSQAIRLLEEQLPALLRLSRDLTNHLVSEYPDYISEAQALEISDVIQQHIAQWGQYLLSNSIHSLPNVIGVIIFLVLVPVLVFFLLKDRDKLVKTIVQMLPERRPIMNQVWLEMNRQVANYIRGKVFEIFIVGCVTFACFSYLQLQYGALLSLLVGLSVLIPFIGAAVATIPVAIVAYFQMGWGPDFFTVLAVYGVIQALDGNVLVPLLFSEAVNLHPVSIITAVLVFGGIWGVWGVFFAIPLATLVKALWTAWPTHNYHDLGINEVC